MQVREYALKRLMLSMAYLNSGCVDPEGPPTDLFSVMPVKTGPDVFDVWFALLRLGSPHSLPGAPPTCIGYFDNLEDMLAAALRTCPDINRAFVEQAYTAYRLTADFEEELDELSPDSVLYDNMRMLILSEFDAKGRDERDAAAFEAYLREHPEEAVVIRDPESCKRKRLLPKSGPPDRSKRRLYRPLTFRTCDLLTESEEVRPVGFEVPEHDPPGGRDD